MGEDPARYPIGGRMSDIVLGLGNRFRLKPLTERHNSVAVLGLFAFVNGLISIGLMSLAPLDRSAVHLPFAGADRVSALLLALAADRLSSNTLCGPDRRGGRLPSPVIFGLVDAGPALVVGMSWASGLAPAMLSLGLTARDGLAPSAPPTGG